MEKDASQPSDPTPTKSPTSSSSPPPPPPPPPPSSLPLDQNNQCHDQQHHEDFAANFLSLYHAIFPPKTDLPSSLSLSLSPSPSSSASSSASTDITTEHRLHQARLILEYQELSDHYDLCLARLQVLTTELESLRQENAEIRSANAELLKLLSLSSPAAIRNHPHWQISNFSPRSAVESGHFERRNVDRSSLPKSISVRSSGYIKVNQQQAQGQEASGRNPSRPRPASQLGSGPVQQRVFVPAEGKGEEEALEFEVYNQGMLKTELCNKWQETGTCPYGRHCQFAHGINELRPVIRHPRYKTEVCRMILAGDACPYGHRCHFRHSLSEQERLLIPR